MTHEGCDILCRLDEEDRQDADQLMEHAIISTDLPLYFTNKQRLLSWLDAGEFQLSKKNHR